MENNGFIPSAANGLQMGRADGHNMHNGKKDTVFTWTDVHERDPTSSVAVGNNHLVLSVPFQIPLASMEVFRTCLALLIS